MSLIKRNRVASLTIVAVVYGLAATLGIFVYQHLTLPAPLSLLLADVAATLLVFVFSLILQNASVYDAYWSVQPVVILTALATGVPLTLPRVLLLIAVWLWGVRLTVNWAYTFPNLYHQDWRYTMLHEKTGVLYPLVNLFGIHLFPTLVVYACVLPAATVFFEETKWNVGTILCFVLCVAATLLQGVADLQMHVFRRRGGTGFIREGLWQYARHPNYLGEILMWWGVALSVLCVLPGRPYLCAGAALNTLMFLFISIPMAEKRQARKEGFAAYKAQTRMLFPIKK